jgi:hypothetical protein
MRMVDHDHKVDRYMRDRNAHMKALSTQLQTIRQKRQVVHQSLRWSTLKRNGPAPILVALLQAFKIHRQFTKTHITHREYIDGIKRFAQTDHHHLLRRWDSYSPDAKYHIYEFGRETKMHPELWAKIATDPHIMAHTDLLRDKKCPAEVKNAIIQARTQAQATAAQAGMSPGRAPGTS